jgi:hypothetical protein
VIALDLGGVLRGLVQFVLYHVDDENGRPFRLECHKKRLQGWRIRCTFFNEPSQGLFDAQVQERIFVKTRSRVRAAIGNPI